MLRFSVGQKKIWLNIKLSRNIMKMIVVPEFSKSVWILLRFLYWFIRLKIVAIYLTSTCIYFNFYHILVYPFWTLFYSTWASRCSGIQLWWSYVESRIWEQRGFDTSGGDSPSIDSLTTSTGRWTCLYTETKLRPKKKPRLQIGINKLLQGKLPTKFGCKQNNLVTM